MDIAFERFLYHKTEMRTLGAITVIIFTLVLVLFKGSGEHALGLFYLHTDLRKIGQLKGRAMLSNECLKVKTIEGKITFVDLNSLLGKIERLLDKIEIRIRHAANGLVRIEKRAKLSFS
jgi:hypothetical protein